MPAVVTPVAYAVTVAIAAVLCVALCAGARRSGGSWTRWAQWLLGLVLLADAVSFAVSASHPFAVRTSLPLPLCDVAALVAAAACFWPAPLLLELTWFWGMAGTLQAVATPDLDEGFPHLVFFQYTVGHLAIVVVALYLVVGLGRRPRRRSAPRVLAITAAYTAFVGLVDWWTGADYMFLRSPPAGWTLLRVLGPWPWYVFSAAGVAVVLVTLLDAPFWPARRRAAAATSPPAGRTRAAA
ncbi:MAG TPA: TIGR02206 family membrane protein [Acidimicrobiales bacterium]|nr:TIGR02206 family membrane protein [Acidimicrobiales bacterium]